MIGLFKLYNYLNSYKDIFHLSPQLYYPLFIHLNAIDITHVNKTETDRAVGLHSQCGNLRSYMFSSIN